MALSHRMCARYTVRLRRCAASSPALYKPNDFIGDRVVRVNNCRSSIHHLVVANRCNQLPIDYSKHC